MRGSPHRITNAEGQPYLDDGSQWFVPFGMRADAGNGDALDAAQRLGYPDSLTRHGWTGHEHADAVGVIQMGGRLYDAEAGRFVQPDPFVQDPFDGQSLNRYSYLLNNPLSGTDPSGYWGEKEQGYLRTVVAIAIAVYTGYYINTATTLTTAQAAGYAALGGAASGAVATGTLRGAVMGAFTGAVGFGIGQAWNAGTWQYVAANATAGGVTEELNGGRFGHGFVTAGLSATIAPQINTGNDFGDGVAYAMLGGTTSVISGGKFANGAATGALQFAMGKAGERAGQNRRMEAAAYGERAYWVAEGGVLDTLTAPWGGWDEFKGSIECIWTCGLPGDGSLEANLAALPPIVGAPVRGLRSGISVLGHYPGYVSTAQGIGARYFNVPSQIWARMSPAEQWAANTRFLDRLVARGDTVVLSTTASQARAGSWFARELEYLSSRGYSLSADGARMLPPVR